mgnify:CR=1 FL=1
MKRKAIECVAPKKPAGKGLTATLQELEKILILNIKFYERIIAMHLSPKRKIYSVDLFRI